jgi:2-polyprenyl-3-methyl-5-hydroxy-6-metoxy-1,4-benzoquinol methylase
LEQFGRYKVLRCAGCTLEFADPLEYSREDYDKAYSTPEDSDFVVPTMEWLNQAGQGMPEARHLLFAAQLEVLEWLQKNRPGASILDVGCGSGWFIARAQQLGFKVFGIEVGGAPIKALQARGFNVLQGSLEVVPESWNPEVVTSFEVLEHLPRPAEFLSQIGARFPKATLILSVPSPKRWTKAGKHRDLADYVPNHLTRWSPSSLRRALEIAGYDDIATTYSTPTGLEIASVSLKSTLDGWLNRLPETLGEAVAAQSLRPLQKEISVRRLKVAAAAACGGICLVLPVLRQLQPAVPGAASAGGHEFRGH